MDIKARELYLKLKFELEKCIRCSTSAKEAVPDENLTDYAWYSGEKLAYELALDHLNEVAAELEVR